MTDGGFDEIKKIQALIFSIQDKKFAVNIEQCKDVNKNSFITGVPRSKSYISGIVNIRGEIITVIELTCLLGYKKEKTAFSSVIVRFKHQNRKEAVRADKIVDIMELNTGELEDASRYLSREETQFIKYVAVVKKDLILFLDSKLLLDSL